VIVRASGVAAEKRGAALMQTDLSTTAFFDGSVSLAPGDEIHCELFDEPRVVAGGSPFARPNASMQYWKVHIVPRSEWVGPLARPPTLQRALDDLQTTVEQLDFNVSRYEAALDIEQIRMELKRSRPDKSRVIGSVRRLSAVAGLEQKSANLLPLVERLFLISDGSW
jgi:hypothetical protein